VKILVVDGEPSIRFSLAGLLGEDGHDAREAPHARPCWPCWTMSRPTG
jgi:DNA-binding NtrC family response regulator